MANQTNTPAEPTETEPKEVSTEITFDKRIMTMRWTGGSTNLFKLITKRDFLEVLAQFVPDDSKGGMPTAETVSTDCDLSNALIFCAFPQEYRNNIQYIDFLESHGQGEITRHLGSAMASINESFAPLEQAQAEG